jgi:putative endonuclease
MLGPNVIRPVSQWRDPRHRRGLAGELAAARYFQAAGWDIQNHRFRIGHHDVDLIVRRGNLVAFVEVKTRASTAFGNGAESVGWRKRSVLRLVATCWIARHGQPRDQYRFDLAIVSWGGAQGPSKAREFTYPHVMHIEDAWRDVDR